MKLAILTSHAIQYQTPLFKKLAEHPDNNLTVYFCWTFGREKIFDPQFGKEIFWDINLLQDFHYKYLRNFSLRPSSDFWGQINPGIVIEFIRNRPDAVIIYGWNSFTNWLTFITAFLSRLPVLLHAENPSNQELLKPKWKIMIKKIILGWLFRRIGAFLYIGEENRKFYKYYGVPEEKLFFVPYAVDNERFIKSRESLTENKKSLRRKIRIGENDAVILFVGKLIEKKRPMDLLLAYRQLTTNDKQLKTKIFLIFVGDGALRPELEKYVREYNLKNIIFVGFKNQTELPRYYSISDVFVLPSGVGETWGLVVNEAMCFGLPVIVSDIVGCGRDLVKNRENGYISPCGEVEKLAECLKKIIENDKMRKLFGKKSFEIIQNYTHEKDIEGILEALKSLKQ